MPGDGLHGALDGSAARSFPVQFQNMNLRLRVFMSGTKITQTDATALRIWNEPCYGLTLCMVSEGEVWGLGSGSVCIGFFSQG
jgi:hypothetical protein